MGLFIFFFGIFAVFVVLPYWIMRMTCDMLQIGQYNRRLRLILWALIAWAAWDWFQIHPVMWDPGRLASSHNQEILLALLALVVASQTWLQLRHWWGAPPKAKWAHGAGEATARAFYRDGFDPEMAWAFLHTPLLSNAVEAQQKAELAEIKRILSHG